MAAPDQVWLTSINSLEADECTWHILRLLCHSDPAYCVSTLAQHLEACLVVVETSHGRLIEDQHNAGEVIHLYCSCMCGWVDPYRSK